MEPGPHYTEVTAQLLDALAFLLVTPEFLGKQTLSSIRSHLQKYASKLQNRIIIIGFFVFLFILTVISIIFVLYRENHNPLGLHEKMGIIAIPYTFGILPLAYYIIQIAAKLAVRRIMFSVGVALFFLARGISVWHAWGADG